jgi:Fe-S-cluster-containing dehydrogenase component
MSEANLLTQHQLDEWLQTLPADHALRMQVRQRSFAPGEAVLREGETGAHCVYLVLSGRAEVFIRQGAQQIGELAAGAVFGELAVLAGLPQPTTVAAAGEEEFAVVEIARAALPALRNLPAFAAALDAAHRRHRHTLLMKELALLTRLDADVATHLSDSSRLHLFEKGHVLFQQGETQRRLFLVKQGWGERTQTNDEATTTQSFGAWQCFGLAGLKEDQVWAETCRLDSASEVLEVALSRLRKQPESLDELTQALYKLAASAIRADAAPVSVAQRQLIVSGLIEAHLLTLIDARKCVRCGNCVTACERMHGQARLNLRGTRLVLPVQLNGRPKPQPFFAPSVCVHCTTPACLPVCEANAITRRPDGRVAIDAAACTGCGDCVASCPYDAITLVPRETSSIAVQCNLCADTPLNPPTAKRHLHACQENCPTGALQHVEVAQLAVVRAIPQAGQAIAEEAKTTAAARFIHLVGAFTVAIGIGLAWWAVRKFGLHTPLHGVGLNLRWLTGLGSSLCLFVALAYNWRRRLVQRRLGPLRYWLIAHGYASCLMMGWLALHHGVQRGSWLTTVLAVVTLMAFLSGVAISLSYRVLPRWLTRLEPQPVLPADLAARRDALRAELAELLVQAADDALQSSALKLLHARRWLWRRDALESMIAAAQKQYTNEETATHPQWLRALELAATMRRIDALLILHRALRGWWWPHAMMAGLMLALLLIHLAQVLMFAAH